MFIICRGSGCLGKRGFYVSISIHKYTQCEIFTSFRSHVKPGTLKICRFHGSGRPRSPDRLVDHDIVLTTYATLSADSSALQVLQKAQWYRVVLDEGKARRKTEHVQLQAVMVTILIAHWIRNQASKQFRASKALTAERKWCLTGTPIQNRLNDLEALLKFLHFEPFSRTSVFQKHILEPLSNDTIDRTRNLKALLGTICLRRNETCLNLPKPLHDIVDIELQDEERQAYSGIINRCARDIDDVVSKRVKNKEYCILFTAIMQLRRLCNHGTLALSISGENPTSATFTDMDCNLCGNNDDDKRVLLSSDQFCIECGRCLSRVPQKPGSKSPSCGSGTSTPSWAGDLNSARPRSPFGLQNRLQGVSTKLFKVAENLAKAPAGSKRYGCLPYFSCSANLVISLVFSYWTSTLHLLQGILEDRNISFLRIDGQVKHQERLSILRDFSENSDIAVLLMSIGTGSVGWVQNEAF